MASLKVTLPEAKPANWVDRDILSTLYAHLVRLGYKPVPADVGPADNAAHCHPLAPCGQVSVEPDNSLRTIEVTGTSVDTSILFTAVLADLQGRNQGLTGEVR